MITEFLRDQVFAIAWLGLMAGAWFGWAQEDPPPSLRPVWGASSVIGFLLAAAFGLIAWRSWDTASALAGRYWVFGAIVLAEAVLIGGGCLVLARRHAARWYGWWIGVCVAIHFIPLAWVFGDWSYLLLTAVQVVGLLMMRPRLTASDHATSRWAAPWIGATFLAYAGASAIVFLAWYGYMF